MAPPRNKPADHFTRFTSATPHATSFMSSSPSSSSSQSSAPRNAPQPGPLGETPAQKVARLRAAHRAAQEAAAYTPMDRIIGTGRLVADKLHRGAAYTLIGFTVVAGGLAVYSGIDLVRHHRRQKRAWIERELGRLREAQAAFLSGAATAEQLQLLEQERAGEELKVQYEEEKRRRKANSLWAKTKRTIFGLGGVKEEESVGEKVRKGEYAGIMDMVKEKEVDANRLLREGEGEVEITTTRPTSVTEAVQQQHSAAAADPTNTQVQGGLLDQIAANNAAAITNKGKSWFTSWGTSGKS